MRDPKDYAGLVAAWQFIDETGCEHIRTSRLASEGIAERNPGWPVRRLYDEAVVSDLTARLAEAEKALGPFAEFGRDNTNADGWMSNIHREAISTWFGPSDFRRAALTSGGGE